MPPARQWLPPCLLWFCTHIYLPSPVRKIIFHFQRNDLIKTWCFFSSFFPPPRRHPALPLLCSSFAVEFVFSLFTWAGISPWVDFILQQSIRWLPLSPPPQLRGSHSLCPVHSTGVFDVGGGRPENCSSYLGIQLELSEILNASLPLQLSLLGWDSLCNCLYVKRDGVIARTPNQKETFAT